MNRTPATITTFWPGFLILLAVPLEFFRESPESELKMPGSLLSWMQNNEINQIIIFFVSLLCTR